jgi:hypothetical protein
MFDVTDKQIIDFRSTVNELSFVHHKYSNKDGKNLFNPICSCMDWISVAIRSIENSPSLSDHIDVKVMQIFSLISSIDLVVESITTLHSIINDTKKRQSPFAGEKSIFTGNELRDDDEFFTQIRARFGAHPVNLKDGNDRMYASWPYPPKNHNHDLEVLLYSNLINKPNIVFGLILSELEAYLISRNMFLQVLRDTLKAQFDEYKSTWAKTPIIMVAAPVEQLCILKKEAQQRLNLDYYVYTIEELSGLFEVSLSEPEHKELELRFKMKLQEYISEIRISLQDMDFEGNLPSHDLLVTTNLYSIRSYELPKLFQWLSGKESDPLVEYYFSRFNDIENSPIKFDIKENNLVTILKLHLLDYHFSENRQIDAVEV